MWDRLGLRFTHIFESIIVCLTEEGFGDGAAGTSWEAVAPLVGRATHGPQQAALHGGFAVPATLARLHLVDGEPEAKSTGLKPPTT